MILHSKTLSEEKAIRNVLEWLGFRFQELPTNKPTSTFMVFFNARHYN